MEIFDNLILTGCVASGKSEFIDFLKKLPTVDERIKLYHIGRFVEMDDHQWIWAMGEMDDLWERLGKKRVYTKNVGCGYVEADGNDVFWDFLDMKLNREISDKYLSNPAFYRENTLFIEFARGGRDGFRKTLNALDADVLKKSAVFFLNNSFKERIRRNNARYEEKKKSSILAHKVPDEVMNNYYNTHDWDEVTGGRADGYLKLKGVDLPFVTVWNEPEVTDAKLIEERFAPPLKKLWELYNKRSSSHAK